MRSVQKVALAPCIYQRVEPTGQMVLRNDGAVAQKTASKLRDPRTKGVQKARARHARNRFRKEKKEEGTEGRVGTVRHVQDVAKVGTFCEAFEPARQVGVRDELLGSDARELLGAPRDRLVSYERKRSDEGRHAVRSRCASIGLSHG